MEIAVNIRHIPQIWLNAPTDSQSLSIYPQPPPKGDEIDLEKVRIFLRWQRRTEKGRERSGVPTRQILFRSATRTYVMPLSMIHSTLSSNLLVDTEKYSKKSQRHHRPVWIVYIVQNSRTFRMCVKWLWRLRWCLLMYEYEYSVTGYKHKQKPKLTSCTSKGRTRHTHTHSLWERDKRGRERVQRKHVEEMARDRNGMKEANEKFGALLRNGSTEFSFFFHESSLAGCSML